MIEFFFSYPTSSWQCSIGCLASQHHIRQQWHHDPSTPSCSPDRCRHQSSRIGTSPSWHRYQLRSGQWWQWRSSKHPHLPMSHQRSRYRWHQQSMRRICSLGPILDYIQIIVVVRTFKTWSNNNSIKLSFFIGYIRHTIASYGYESSVSIPLLSLM